MNTIRPTSGMIITEDTRFEPGVYPLEKGVTIAADGITLEGAGAHLIGISHKGVGIHLQGVQNVTIKNVQLSGFYHGIRSADCQSLTITHCIIKDTLDYIPDVEGMNIWREPVRTYGGAILLEGVRYSHVVENDLSHQMIGVMAYYCREIELSGNLADHNTRFGFLLYETSHCTLKDNKADFCGRMPSKPGLSGDKDVEAAGFLLLHNSSQNTFIRNSARLGENGFHLAGLTPDLDRVPCNNNHFELCDGSNNMSCAFETAYCQNNVFINNQANLSNYGFRIRFGLETEISGNTIQGNRRAGIAAENSAHCQVENNTVQDNQYGVLLWTKPNPKLLTLLPGNDTSKFWDIQGNSLHRNHTGIRIAANQDQGFLPLMNLQGENPETYLRPHDHEIRLNDISGNRIGIQTVHCDRTVVQDNSFSLNLSGDIKS